MEWNFLIVLSEASRQFCQNCILHVHRKTLRKKIFRKKNTSFPLFRILSERFSDLCSKKFGGTFKTAFYVSVGIFWWTVLFETKVFLHFWTFSGKCSAFWWKNYGWVVKTTFNWLMAKFWRKLLFEKNSTFSDIERKVFGLLATNFLRFFKAALYKYIGIVWGKNFFRKLFYFHQFRTMGGRISVFCR